MYLLAKRIWGSAHTKIKIADPIPRKGLYTLRLILSHTKIILICSNHLNEMQYLFDFVKTQLRGSLGGLRLALWLV